ncbi:MAG: carbamoyltransferase HypF [Anaerolineae bacterium]|nr:carbamoyltransferase HypF [Anaerolineae bacterium]
MTFERGGGNHVDTPAATAERRRVRLLVRGIVQGVGFRPFVYGLAQRYRLGGHVGNNGAGVFIEIEGDSDALTAFQTALVEQAPPLARIEAVTVEPLEATGGMSFIIVESEAQAVVSALIPPDLAICDDCLRELFDPSDRRYHYPFINCTNCGPRFSIIEQLPYDRAATTMASFAMCPDCAAEYHDPSNRRFHAQPNACPVCGPQVWYTLAGSTQADAAPTDTRGADAIAAAKAALADGKIVAVKGLGGFHLACAATRDDAVMRLRERKGRVDKPFAIMARDLDAARQIAFVSDDEAQLLTSRERPILLLRKHPGSALSALVAPGNAYVGVMLPYTPLHYLLIDDTPLVMTSGNYSDEPIVKDNEAALAALTPLVDAFLFHDRPIQARCDDSVVRIYEGHELPVRRSRGYTPFPVRLPFEVKTLLATGGELKNTFCLTQDHYAFMSQHIGDMENLETLDAYGRAVDHLCSLYHAEPEAVVCDLHPGYMTTDWAAKYAAARDIPLLRVQHHHAHIAGAMAEHQLDGTQPVIGVCFDGTGYGTDGAIWGGEVLVADYAGFRRAAHLKYVPLPGGDAAIKRPYRLALAHLWAAGVAWDDALAPVAACSETEQRVLRRQFETGFKTVSSSSMGRLFDAVAALIGLRQTITYEAQAAIELEGLLPPLGDASDEDGYTFALHNDGDGRLIDPVPVIAAVVDDLLQCTPPAIMAARFHAAVADVIARLCALLREETGLSVVALSGGVFQNVHLLDATVQRLRSGGFSVHTHKTVPANDGGLALGQAIIGCRQLESRR